MSLRRVSPSSIVTRRVGKPSRRTIAVVTSASEGATMAPRTKAAAQGIRGASEWATAATAAIVTSTSATARRKMGRAFFLVSRSELVEAAR